ncbi:MAG: AraC family transcriptional regulator ligand-binding domain-containing protein [Motiliproteus sp.]
MMAPPTATSLASPNLATASAKLIDPVLQVARHSQQDPSLLLASIGIEADSIGQAGARIPAALFSSLLKELAQRTDNPRLALRVGEATQPRMLGSVGFLMATAPTLGQAYHSLNDYLPLLIEGLNLSLEQDEEQVTLVLDLADDTDRVLVEWFLACLHNWMRWLTGKQIPLTRVDFAFSEPASAQTYEQFFAAEVSFNADRNRLRFSANYLELSCLDANEEMQRLHQTFADQLLSSAGRDGALVAQVKSLIRNRLGSSNQPINRQQVADQLNLSLRTLQRKLDQQGTHFQALFDQTRKDLALQLIQRGGQNFGEIAYQLGFSSLSAFQKAFKRWTDMAPGSYRNSQRPKTLIPYRSQPQSLADLIGTSGLSEQKFYPLALQLLELVQNWRQHGLKRLLLSPARISVVTDDLLDYRVTLVDPEPFEPPSLLEQLSYEAPEASLALPYAVDDRSELYQLGCLFYCTLHGQPPYTQNEPSELLRTHIQQSPLLDPNLSVALIQILKKLLAVPAEERYQSINGLKLDLKQSLLAYQQQQSLSGFEPGCSDAPEQIIGRGRLIGREPEQQTLNQLLQQMGSSGHLLLIEGPHGCGKSSLIECLRSPLFLSQGALIKGRFDTSSDDDIELFIQLARQRLRHKLALPHARRNIWAQRLQQQLGSHASLLQQLLPELGALLGRASTPTKLGYSERRPLLIQALAKLFRANRDPLVIFVDDLHHASSDGLTLLQLMIDQLEQQPLLLVISYDASRVAEQSPISTALQNYRYQRRCSLLTLNPLSRHATQQLLLSLFQHMTPELTALADWLYQRTGGLPGHLAEELDLLRQKQWLRYQPQQQCWQWQPDELPESLSNDLEKLLTTALTDLPAASLELLQWAAVVGDPFDLELLAESRQDPLARVSIHLWPAQQAGLLQALDSDATTCSFGHPGLRLQLLRQLPVDKRAEIHWLVGDALLQRQQHQSNPAPAPEQMLLQRCVEQLNQGYRYDPKPEQRQSLTQLNLNAAQLSAADSNFGLADRLYRQAYSLLQTTEWQSDLATEILQGGAALAYCYDDPAVKHHWLTKLQQYQHQQEQEQEQEQEPNNDARRLPFALLIGQLQQQSGAPQQATATLIDALSECDIELPQDNDVLSAGLQQLLSDSPKATFADQHERALLIELRSLAQRQLDPQLLQSSLLTLAQYSSQQPCYPIYQALLQLELLNQPAAARTLTASDSWNNNPQKPEQAPEQPAEQLQATLLRSARITPWIGPLVQSVEQLQHLLSQARHQPDLASLCVLPLYNSRWFSGEPLGPLRSEVESEQTELDQRLSPDRQSLTHSASWLLRRLTYDRNSDISDNNDDSNDNEAGTDTSLLACPWALTARCAVNYLLDNRSDWPALLAQAETAQARLSGLYAQAQLLLFTTLMAIELAIQRGRTEPRLLVRLHTNQAWFSHWATINPEGFGALAALIDAEIAQLNDLNHASQEDLVLASKYQRALLLCETTGGATLTAIAYERFAVYCQRNQQPSLARLLLAESRRHYRIWGATAKFEQLQLS